MITTTLKKIRSHKPCENGYRKLCRSLGGVRKYGSDTPITFSRIIKSNGVADAIWCLITICPEHEREVRLFAADCAECVLHVYEKAHPDDNRPRKALEAARAFADGKITVEKLAAARAAVAAIWGAADAAARAAVAAIWGAADAAAAAAATAIWDAWEAAVACSITTEREAQGKLLIKRFG